MSHSNRLWLLALVVGIFALPAQAQSLMNTTSTPLRTANSSFFERMGTSWSFNHPGVSINFGQAGFGNSVPQFGGYAPGAGVSGGASFPVGGGQFNLGWEFSQGSRRSLTSVTPSVTTMNGVPGFVADQSQSPFVISVIPVVGDRSAFRDFGASNTVRGRLLRSELRGDNHRSPGSIIPQRASKPAVEPIVPKPQIVAEPKQAPRAAQTAPKKKHGPLVLRAADSPAPAATAGGGGGTPSGQSSAEVASASIEDIVARQQAERSAEATRQAELAAECYAKGQKAEADGKIGSARIYYQMALRRANGDMKDEIEQRLAAITR